MFLGKALFDAVVTDHPMLLATIPNEAIGDIVILVCGDIKMPVLVCDYKHLHDLQTGQRTGRIAFSRRNLIEVG